MAQGRQGYLLRLSPPSLPPPKLPDATGVAELLRKNVDFVEKVLTRAINDVIL